MNPVQSMRDRTGLSVQSLVAIAVGCFTVLGVVIGIAVGVVNGYREVLDRQDRNYSAVIENNEQRASEHTAICTLMKGLHQDLRLHIIISSGNKVPPKLDNIIPPVEC